MFIKIIIILSCFTLFQKSDSIASDYDLITLTDEIRIIVSDTKVQGLDKIQNLISKYNAAVAAGKTQNAVDAASGVLMVSAKVYGNKSQEHTTTLVNTANAYGIIKKYEVSKKLLKEAIENCEGFTDKNSPLVLQVYMLYAQLLAMMGDKEESVFWFNKSEIIAPEYLKKLINTKKDELLASTDIDRYNETNENYVFNKLFLFIKPDDKLISYLRDKGISYSVKARYLLSKFNESTDNNNIKDAVSYIDAILLISDKVFSADSSEYISLLINAANTHAANSDNTTAKKIFEIAINSCEEFHGKSETSVKLYAMYAYWLSTVGNREESEYWFEKADKIAAVTIKPFVSMLQNKSLSNTKNFASVKSTEITVNPNPQFLFITEPILKIEVGMHTSMINRIDVDRSGRWLVSASDDKTVRIWDLESLKLNTNFKPLQILRPPIGFGVEGLLYTVAISPDGALVATAGFTKAGSKSGHTIYVFNRSSGQLVMQAGDIQNAIDHVAFSPDGDLLVATGPAGMNLFFVSKPASTLRLVAYDNAYGEDAYGADFSPDNKTLVTSSYDGAIRLYNLSLLTNRKNIATVNELKPSIKIFTQDGVLPHTIKYSPDGSKVAVGFSDRPVVDVLFARDLSLLYRPNLRGINAGVNAKNLSAVCWSPDGRYLYAAGTYLSPMEVNLMRRWDDGGKGKFEDIVSGVTNSVISLVPYKDVGVVLGASDPVLVGLDINGTELFKLKSTILDFTGVFLNKGFGLSFSGDEIGFAFHRFNVDGAIFSVTNRTLTQKNVISTLLPPDTTSLALTDWFNTFTLKLNEKIIVSSGNERLRSLSIAPNKQSFLLGSEFSLRKYDKNGIEQWKVNCASQAFAVNISGDGRLAVAALGDGTIRWYEYATGKELLAFFPHADRKRWIMWTPEGYFDSSEGGTELIGYHINQGKDKEAMFVPVSYLYDVFYRPDIVQARLRGEDISSLVTLSAQEALRTPAPQVSFSNVPKDAVKDKAKICYKIESTGGGIGEIRLFQNGKLVKSDGFYRESVVRRPAEKMQLASLDSTSIYRNLKDANIKQPQVSIIETKGKGNLVEECVELDPIPGDNEISIAAFNAPNTVQSFMATTRFISNRPKEEPHLYILSIGIDKFKDTSAILKFATKDAADFLNQMQQKAGTLYGPQNIHITKLTDQQATKPGIQQTLAELSQRIRPGDGFILFVASHGILLGNQYYIVTSGYDGTSNTANLISSNEIVDLSKQVKSLSQLFIFDTCHAGGVDAIVSGLYDARMSVLAKKMGLHIYASAGSLQSALDGFRGNGLFTYTLLEGIKNPKEVSGASEKPVTVVNLGQYAKEKTSVISKRLGSPQTPTIINFGKDYKLIGNGSDQR